MSAPPLLITVYDKNYNRLGWIGDPEQVTLVPRHNQQPTASVTVANDHPQAVNLVTEGCRVAIDYYGVQTVAGVVDSAQGNPMPGQSLTVQVQGAWSIVMDLLGWPVPGSAITAQNTAAYDIRTGPAETVFKAYLAAAVARAGAPVTIATDLGRGSTIGPVNMRMQPLGEVLVPLVDKAGIGISVQQVAGGLLVDCYEPAWYPSELTPASGIIADATWSLAAPKHTRYVAGGQGDLTARAFRQYVDTTAESLYGIVREGFVDATDVTATTEPALTNALVAKALQAAVEDAATAGLALTLTETDTFRYGEALRVGDLVTARLVPSATPTTDVLREATISWSKDDGLTVTPTVGERTDDPTKKLIGAVRSLTTRVSNIVTRR